MAHFDTGELHCINDCGYTKCSCGKIWDAIHRQEIRSKEGEERVSTYLVSWTPDNTPDRHMFQLIEAASAEDAVRKFENIYNKTARSIAFPLSGNGWGYLREVVPPNDKRVSANIVY